MDCILRRSLIVLGMLLTPPALYALPGGDFTLTSTTFKDGQMMPRRVANLAASHNPVNPNCVGDNVSPQLGWSHAPDGTKSFALIVVEPEGRGGAGTYHFIAYGIPASLTSLAEGELSKPSPHFVGGKSSHGLDVYSGPCTAPGPPHHYAYVLIATDLDPKELAPGLTRDELMAKLVAADGKSHAKGSTGIVGYFQNVN
jgi:Raf kinase inhibitor-like YbhB/YbcL family protein